jgi:hypothetical protein
LLRATLLGHQKYGFRPICMDALMNERHFAGALPRVALLLYVLLRAPPFGTIRGL